METCWDKIDLLPSTIEWLFRKSELLSACVPPFMGHFHSRTSVIEGLRFRVFPFCYHVSKQDEKQTDSPQFSAASAFVKN